MAESVIQVSGLVNGDKEVDMALAQSPHLIKGQIIHQWKKERDMFIGKRGGKPGVFKKKLLRKNTFGGRIGRNAGKWSKQFVGLVRGKVTAGPKGTMNGLELGMGHFFKSQKRIHKAFEMLGSGGTISSGSKEMLIPIYENLSPKLKTGMTGIIMRDYGKGRKKKSLVRIQGGGAALYYDRELFEQRDYEHALMFVGVHRVTIKKQFDFDRDWKRRMPKVTVRTQKAVDRAIDKINKA